jgi:hypothetical protein
MAPTTTPMVTLNETRHSAPSTLPSDLCPREGKGKGKGEGEGEGEGDGEGDEGKDGGCCRGRHW